MAWGPPWNECVGEPWATANDTGNMVPWTPPIPPNVNTNPTFPYSPGPGIWDTSLAWGTAPQIDASALAPSPAYNSTLAAPALITAVTMTVTAAPTQTLPFMAMLGSEAVLVTGKSGTTLTVARAQCGTAAAAYSTGQAIASIGYYPAGTTKLNLKNLGLGIAIQPWLWLPDGAWFTINSQTVIYEIQMDAQLGTGLGTCVGLIVAPGLAVAVADGTPVSDYNALCIDNDLTLQESRMPALAKKTVAIGMGGASAYTGKRELAKRDLGQWIYRRGYELSGLLDLTEFNRSAVFLELSYIYRDLATRNDEISAEKAAYYLSQYGAEIESVRFDYQPPQSSVSQFQQRPVCSWWRS
jgi:hypothetical protein